MDRYTVHELIIKANELLKKGSFEYAFCGGFAIELFLNRTIRKHGDIDVSAYWNDRDKIILYMQSLGWPVHAIKQIGGFSKDDNSRFDRALVDLQMKMYLTICGRQETASARCSYGAKTSHV